MSMINTFIDGFLREEDYHPLYLFKMYALIALYFLQLHYRCNWRWQSSARPDKAAPGVEPGQNQSSPNRQPVTSCQNLLNQKQTDYYQNSGVQLDWLHSKPVQLQYWQLGTHWLVLVSTIWGECGRYGESVGGMGRVWKVWGECERVMEWLWHFWESVGGVGRVWELLTRTQNPQVSCQK